MNRLVSIFVLSMAPVLALGHHSNAEYDSTVVRELEGEVASVSWRNPHVELTLRIENADGTESVWDLEAQDINSLSRRGLDGSLINVGDIIRVAGHASTRRENNMSITNVLLPGGTEISIRGNPQPRWSTENIGFVRTSVEEALAAAGEGEGIFRVWMSAAPGGFSAELPLTSAARAAQADWDPANDPTMQCIPSGMPAAMRLSPPHPIDLTDQGDTIMLRVELFDIVRTIHMSAETEVADQGATPLGFSEGHWEGDSLVVRTTDVNWPYFDHLGSIPQSDAVEMTERFTVSDDGNQLVYDLMVIDPATFSQPVSGRWVMNWRPDLVVEPYECIAGE
ncbi:MAG: DUF6152 family protein [Gammaproteobacteria bacterium]